MESAYFLPQGTRFVVKPNGIVFDIYNNDRVQHKPRMVRPRDTVIVSKKKPAYNQLWAFLIVPIIFLFLFVFIIYIKMQSPKVTYDKIPTMEVLKNGHCAGITGPKSTFLWTINAPHLTSTSYLFGTIHVPNMWNNVSSQAKNAFNNSDALALEVDLRDPELIKTMNTCFKFPNGTAIELFPNKTDIRQRIQRMAGFFEMNVGEFQNPYGFNNLTNLTNKDPVLDELLNSMAKAERKPVISVETAEEGCENLKVYIEIQIASILLTAKLEKIIEEYKISQSLYWRSQRSINGHMSQKEDEEDRLLVKTYACNILNRGNFINGEDKIRQINDKITEIESLRTRNSYGRGDPLVEIYGNRIVEIYRAYIKLYERFIEVILTKRNAIMGRRINEMLRKNPNTKYFIAFGVGHFIGKYSVQNHLISYGYTIKEVPFTDHLDNFIL